MTSPVLPAPSRERHEQLVADWHQRLGERALRGTASSRARHVARGKLLPRERVERLLDSGSPFLEIALQHRVPCVCLVDSAGDRGAGLALDQPLARILAPEPQPPTEN